MVTKGDVRRVLQKVNRATDLAYFFDSLTSPDWLEALQESGLFDDVPGEELEGDFVRYPGWAASRYLGRIASLAPHQVFSLIQQLPESNNPRVHEDLTRAACAMPTELARQMVPRIKRWVETDRHLLLLPERVVELCIRLANAGAVDDALDLARSLLGLSVEGEVMGGEIRARLTDHDYVESIEQLDGPLAAAGPSAALKLFVDLLDDALSQRYASTARRDGTFEDGSTIWRRDLEVAKHGATGFQPILNTLVDAVLSMSRASAARDGDSPFEILRHARASVFRRIELQLLADLQAAVPRLTLVRLLVSRYHLSDYTLEIEYLRALRNNASRLTVAEGRKLVKWIKLGPLRSGVLSKRFASDWDDYLIRWQAQRAAALGSAIPAGDREWSQSLLAKVAIEELLPVPTSAVVSWVGPTSPRSIGELSATSLDELVSYLREWKPTGEWASPSPEGLGRALSEVVAREPFRFSRSAIDFVGLDPVYVRSFFSGLRDALSNDLRVSWRPVIDLAAWVVDQPLGGREVDWVGMDRDPGWEWTWTEIARVLDQGLTTRSNRLPRSMSAKVTALVLALIAHPDPEPESEAQFGGSNMEPHMLSLNTGRGTATHTLIRLAWWQRQALGRKRMHRDVRAELERLATPTEETSAAVHSVFGAWFTTLSWLDVEWAEMLVSRIFPRVPEQQAMWWAAWSSFVVFDRPSTPAHRLLYDEYSTAIERLGSSREHNYFRAGRTHAEALAGHILAYVAWGTEGDPASGLLGLLLHGPETARVEFVRQAGRLLRDYGEQLEPPIVGTLQRLWELRRSVFEATGGHEMRDEVAQFSWWCGASVLDTRWWLGEMQWVARNVTEIDAPFVVLDALPGAADTDPLAAVRIVDAISRTDRGWTISGHAQEVAEVLKAALARGGEAGRQAERVIHYLGARELADFSHLLP